MRLLCAAVAAMALTACAHDPNVALAPAIRETPPVGVAGDAADDPAIWIAPYAAHSRIVGTQKQGGLFVYDLAGSVVQAIPYGRPNNIDLRDGFAWREGEAPILAASDRADNSLTLWRLDPVTGRLSDAPLGRIPTGWAEVYGVCLGRIGDDVVAIATSHDGEVRAWRITLDETGAPRGEALHEPFALGSISEGCVVDDATGDVYIAQELEGVWRYSFASHGADRRLIDRVGGGRLVADVEGLAIWRDNVRGYLVVSVQGRSRFGVYDLDAANTYRGAFRVGPSADGSVDGVSGTDGLDIVSTPLGGEFPRGLVVVQDDENTAPAATQDFKYVSWADVAAALQLP